MYSNALELIDTLDEYYSRLENVGYIPYAYVDRILVELFKAEFE